MHVRKSGEREERSAHVDQICQAAHNRVDIRDDLAGGVHVNMNHDTPDQQHDCNRTVNCVRQAVALRQHTGVVSWQQSTHPLVSDIENHSVIQLSVTQACSQTAKVC